MVRQANYAGQRSARQADTGMVFIVASRVMVVQVLEVRPGIQQTAWHTQHHRAWPFIDGLLKFGKTLFQ